MTLTPRKKLIFVKATANGLNINFQDTSIFFFYIMFYVIYCLNKWFLSLSLINLAIFVCCLVGSLLILRAIFTSHTRVWVPNWLFSSNWESQRTRWKLVLICRTERTRINKFIKTLYVSAHVPANVHSMSTSWLTTKVWPSAVLATPDRLWLHCGLKKSLNRVRTGN